MLARFGSLGLVGYFEMANRLVSQLRQLLVASNQVLVPVFAGLQETSMERVREMYLESYRVMAYLAVPFFAIIAVAVPWISWFWIGRYEPAFVVIAELATIALGVNTLVVPAYFANLGTGELRWNTISHAAIGVLNAALGYGFGLWIGGLAVVAGWSLALILGSAMLPIAFHRCHGLGLGELFPRGGRIAMLVMVAIAALGIGVASGWGPWQRSAQLAALALSAFVPVAAMPAWRHPLRRRLLFMIGNRISRDVTPV
jgi:O-antigen/teichoic acid export membrane protein